MNSSITASPFIYTIIRKAFVKRMRLTVRSGEILVTAPPHVNHADIEEFVRQNRDWISAKLKKCEELKAGTPSYRFTDGEKLPFLGSYYTLSILESPRKNILIRSMDNNIVVWLPSGKKASGGANMVRSSIIKWYHKKALELIKQRLTYYNRDYRFNYRKVSIRNQKTRWGSCSSLGNLNFNFRLVLAPLEILDYVVVHELAHLKERNHSSDFWNLVARQIPDYKDRRRWLKENGHLLNL